MEFKRFAWYCIFDLDWNEFIKESNIFNHKPELTEPAFAATYTPVATLPATPGSGYATPQEVHYQYIPEIPSVPPTNIASISLIAAEYSHMTVTNTEQHYPENEELIPGNRTIFLMIPESKLFLKQQPSLAQIHVLTSTVENDLATGVEFNLFSHWQQPTDTTNFTHWYDSTLSPSKTKARILKDIAHSYWMRKHCDLELSWMFEKVDSYCMALQYH